MEKCPFCRKDGVRRASGAPRHWLRVITRSRKRYCPSCSEKWHIERAAAGAGFSPEEIVLATSLVAAPLVLALATHPYFLKDWFKTQVRGYYDEKYGAQSHDKLWRDLGWLYGGRQGATNDYGLHHKK